ncbi:MULTISPECIES: hypothetical protein [Xanthomonas]|jgi:hypothetical protein|uniref:hypothetical protein n=1 Tax=Xanthomonas TaxID=338 RepID=UPI000A738D19|nr:MULTISPECIES: hypothetical protein [Xanthomonas]CAD1791326.1 hypothetical protein XSP_001926 [Xanthomonas sp. CPBF 426]CAG2089378.1 hypothetical protein XCY_001890 [Xanthomonas euroxanthea]
MSPDARHLDRLLAALLRSELAVVAMTSMAGTNLRPVTIATAFRRRRPLAKLPGLFAGNPS